MNLNEHEIIRKFIDIFAEKCRAVYGISVTVRNIHMEKPAATEDYKDYKDGKSSTDTEVNFELGGWKSYSDEGIKNFMMTLLDEDDDLSPIVNLEVYEMHNKGKTTVKVVFSMVYARYDITTDGKVVSDLKSGAIDKNDIINQIELRLSEIYTLLKKLRS